MLPGRPAAVSEASRVTGLHVGPVDRGVVDALDAPRRAVGADLPPGNAGLEGARPGPWAEPGPAASRSGSGDRRATVSDPPSADGLR